MAAPYSRAAGSGPRATVVPVLVRPRVHDVFMADKPNVWTVPLDEGGWGNHFEGSARVMDRGSVKLTFCRLLRRAAPARGDGLQAPPVLSHITPLLEATHDAVQARGIDAHRLARLGDRDARPLADQRKELLVAPARCRAAPGARRGRCAVLIGRGLSATSGRSRRAVGRRRGRLAPGVSAWNAWVTGADASMPRRWATIASSRYSAIDGSSSLRRWATRSSASRNSFRRANREWRRYPR